MTYYTYSRIDGAIKDRLNQYAWKHFNQEPTHVENTNDARTHWTKTYFATLIEALQPGDVIITDEANHLGCSIVQLLEILEVLNNRQVDIHFVKYAIAMKTAEPDLQKLLALISVIEREFISSRTVLALSRRKAQGLPLGRPKGSLNRALKLDQFRIDIERYLGLGISKASIAKLVDCHPQTLYDWIERGRDRLIVR